MKISEAFVKVDNFGVFQKFLIMVLAIPAVFQGLQTSSTNFISGQPERWCKIDRLKNFSFSQQKDIAIPYDSESEYDSCHAFDLDWERYTTEDFLKWNRSVINGSVVTVPCDKFVYSKEVFSETAFSKWNLVCSNSALGELIATLYVVGLFLGSVTSGRMSDSLGRRSTLFGFSVILMIMLFAAAFVPNAIAFMVLRLLIGFAARGANVSSAVLTLELCGPKQRELAGALVPASFSIGVMLCSAIAFALRDFQNLHIVMGGMETCILFAMFFIPESPRWLLVKGKVEKAENTLKWIGQINNHPLPADFTLKSKESPRENEREKVSFFDLFRHPVLRKHTFIMYFLWVVVNFSYIAMTLNLGALTGNAYVNVFLSGVTEFPATISILFVMKYFGRKKAFLIYGTVFSLCNGIAIPFELIADLRLGASIFTILARASASALVSVLQVLTVELFPTPLRQRVLGTALGCGAAIGISGPYLGGTLRNIWRPLPNIIFGSLGVAGVISAMFLPETIGRGLPDTVEEAVTFDKKDREAVIEILPTVSDSVDKQTENGISGKPNGFIATPSRPYSPNANDANTMKAFRNDVHTKDSQKEPIEFHKLDGDVIAIRL